ncbi:MAG: lytic transglycosylase domain-containing protein [Rhodospirillaceae bacterium]|nr:lytic transglycosylase domain-containing protein [Rhodospirillaceae bacterium]
MLNPVEASTRSETRRLVVEEAMNSHVPPSLAMAVAKVESDFQPKALSSAGARGVMQIMPATAMGEYGVGAEELWDARLNVQLGIDFLESLIARYEGRWDLALSHYNGGSVMRTRSGMEPLLTTRKYVERVLAWQKRYAEQATVWALADMPDDSWQPARTRRNYDDTTVARRAKWSPSDDRLDDFGKKLEERRLRMRGTLDDFTSTIIWHEG